MSCFFLASPNVGLIPHYYYTILCCPVYCAINPVLQGENICLQKFHFEHVLGMIISPEQSYLCNVLSFILVAIWCTFFRLLATVLGSNLNFGVNLVNPFQSMDQLQFLVLVSHLAILYSMGLVSTVVQSNIFKFPLYLVHTPECNSSMPKDISKF